MNQSKQDVREAARAKRAAAWADALEQAREDRPISLEMMAYRCQEWRDRYLALQKAGFTPAEALELCWRSA